MGVVDNDGICVSDIDTVLDNCRSQQHIELTVDKVHNELLQILGRHTSVTHTHTCFWTQTCDESLDSHQILNAVMHKIYLTATCQLLLDSILDNLLGEEV